MTSELSGLRRCDSGTSSLHGLVWCHRVLRCLALCGGSRTEARADDLSIADSIRSAAVLSSCGTVRLSIYCKQARALPRVE